MDSIEPKKSAVKRTSPLSWRASKDDEKIARAMANELGISVNALFTLLVRNASKGKPVVCKKELALSLSQEAILVGLYQVILKRTSDPLVKLLIEQCLDVSDEKRADIVKALGKRS